MNGIQIFAVTLAVVLSMVSLGESVQMTKCDLAKRLKLHGAPNYAEWVCIADVNTGGTFDTAWTKGDDFGLWEISSREWCKDSKYPEAPNMCNFDCTRFNDGFLTDDLRCLNQIHAERGFFGFQGWFRRFRACPNINTYLNECGL